MSAVHARPFRSLLILGVIVTLLLGASPLTPAALAAYAPGLITPAPPAASTTFTWGVSGVKPGRGQEISHVDLSGCWSSRDVAAATALDKNRRPLQVEVHTGGPRVNTIQVKNLSDASLPITIKVVFKTSFGSAPSGTKLVVAGGKGSATTASVGGPTCRAANQPPAASSGAATTAEDTPVQVTLSATDSDSPALSFAVSAPAGGSVGAVTTPVCAAASGGTTCTATAVYTPAPNFNGSGGFTWTASDDASTSAAATMAIAVTAVNDPPAFSDAPANTAQSIAVGAGLAALQASDVDGDKVVYALAGGSLPPGIALDPSGAFTGVAGDEAGVFTATISASDGQGGAATTDLAVTVVKEDAPARVDLTVSSFSAQPQPDGSIALSVSVSNAGTASPAGPFLVYFLADAGGAVAAAGAGQPALRGELPALAPGASDTLTYAWRAHPLAEGEHTLTALVDGAQAIPEADETNNALSTTLSLTRPAPAPDPIVPPTPEPQPQPSPTENLQAWGQGYLGQLGDGASEWVRTKPASVPGLFGVTRIAAGATNSFAVTSDGSLWAWGSNADGSLGVPATDTCPYYGPCVKQPTQVGGLADVVDVATTYDHTMALTRDGKVWAWGTNRSGILGDGTYETPLTPALAGIDGVAGVASAYFASLVVKADGTVWAWGVNTRGILGDDPSYLWDSARPVQVPGLSNIVALSSTDNHALALRSDGTVWAWGENEWGQIGNGERPETGCRCVYTPVQVAGLPPIRSVHTGLRHSLAVAVDGTVWVWGESDAGQMGDGKSSDTVDRLTPFQVPGLAGVRAADVRHNSNVVLKEDGTVWGWGQNIEGSLGQTTGEYCSSYPCIAAPLQLNQLQAEAVAAGNRHYLALQIPGTAIPACAPSTAEGQFIVRLADSVADPELVAHELEQQLGLSVTQVYRAVFKGFAARVPSQSVEALRSDSRVLLVEGDAVGCYGGTVEGSAARAVVPPGQHASTGLQRIGGSSDGAHQTLSRKGTGVGVAVLDTGVALAHPDLAVVPGKTCVPGTVDPGDDHGHGTHVAGIIAARDDGAGAVGVAPEATIYAVKVGTRTGETPMSMVICGIEWVTEHADQIQVVNMSLSIEGSATPSAADCSNANNDLLHTAICQSVKKGVTYVAAAGNEAASTLGSLPAAYEEVITVSALADFDGRPGGRGAGTARTEICTETADDSFACFSNFGAAVDIAAPGVNIYSTVPTGPCTLCAATGYEFASGTSMAAPFVAGAAALYKQERPSATPAEVKQYLLKRWEQGPIPQDPDVSEEGILYVGEPMAYVANEGDGTVSVIDLSKTTTTSIALTPRSGPDSGPFDLALSPAGDYLYAIHGLLPGSMAVIDTRTNTQVASGPLNAPRKLAVNPWTGTVVAIDNDAPILVDWLRVIDGERQKLIGSVLLGPDDGDQGRDLVFSPDGTLLYVLVGGGFYDTSEVRVFDGLFYQPMGRISVPPDAKALSISPAGSRLYVLHKDDRMTVIDTATRAITGSVPIGSGPAAMETIPFVGEAYIANAKGNNVTVLDTATNEVRATVPVGLEPGSVAVDLFSYLVYVTNYGSNTVSVIEPGSYRLVANLGVGARPVQVVARR